MNNIQITEQVVWKRDPQNSLENHKFQESGKNKPVSSDEDTKRNTNISKIKEEFLDCDPQDNQFERKSKVNAKLDIDSNASTNDSPEFPSGSHHLEDSNKVFFETDNEKKLKIADDVNNAENFLDEDAHSGIGTKILIATECIKEGDLVNCTIPLAKKEHYDSIDSLEEDNCDFCFKSFTNLYDLKNHLKEHTDQYKKVVEMKHKSSSQTTSIIDSKKQSEGAQSSLIENEETETRRRRKYEKSGLKCNKSAVCKKIFNFQRDLIKHHKLYHSKRSFRFVFKRKKSNEEKKSERLMGPKQKFNPCEKGSSKKSNARNESKHYEEVKSEPCDNDVKNIPCTKQQRYKTNYPCPVCGKSFNAKQHLNSHIEIHSSEREYYSCSICDKSFTAKSSLGTHLRKHTTAGSHSCSVCSKTFYKNYDLKIHSIIHTRAYEERKRRQQEIKLNIHSTKTLGKKDTTIYPCSVCGKSFMGKQNFNNHIVIHSSERETYSCSMCDKKFTAKSSLGTHLRKHTTVGSHSCSVCSKTFYRNYDLKIHSVIHTRAYQERKQRQQEIKSNLNIHSSKRPRKKNTTIYSCSVCGKSFMGKHIFNNHIVIHSSERPAYSCSMCDKSFTAKSSLGMHLRKHTTVGSHPCSICPKTFYKNYDLKVHLKAHRKHPFQCSICFRGFSESIRLEIHLRAHTGEYPHSCPICSREFSSEYNLAKHLKIHSKEQATSKERTHSCEYNPAHYVNII